MYTMYVQILNTNVISLERQPVLSTDNGKTVLLYPTPFYLKLSIKYVFIL